MEVNYNYFLNHLFNKTNNRIAITTESTNEIVALEVPLVSSIAPFSKVTKGGF